MKNRRVQRNVNIVAEDQWPCISPEQREKARRCLLLHSCFQLKTWKADCPLSQQDTIDNIKLQVAITCFFPGSHAMKCQNVPGRSRMSRKNLRNIG